MLASIILHLRPLKDARLGRTPERSLHALFLELVREADEETATRLHSAIPLKSFTVSPLRGRLTWQDERLLVSTKEAYRVRFTTLTEEALAPFSLSVMGHWIHREPVAIEGVPFISPTTFRKGDVNLLFPLPVSVFGSLCRKWEAFSRIPPG